MKYSNIIFLSAIILSGCSPLDRYLGFTPIEGAKPGDTQLQKTKNHSAQNAGNSSGESKNRASVKTASNTNAVSDSTDQSPSNNSDDEETDVTSNTYTGGIPDGTSANESTPAEVFLDDPEEPEVLPATN